MLDVIQHLIKSTPLSLLTYDNEALGSQNLPNRHYLPQYRISTSITGAQTPTSTRSNSRRTSNKSRWALTKIYLSALSKRLLELHLCLPIPRSHSRAAGVISPLARGHLIPESVIAIVPAAVVAVLAHWDVAGAAACGVVAGRVVAAVAVFHGACVFDMFVSLLTC